MLHEARQDCGTAGDASQSISEGFGWLEAIPLGAVICDAQGLIRNVNEVLLKLFGYRASELLGKNIDVLLPDEHRAHHQSHLAAYMADPEKRVMGFGRELFARRQDGSVFPVEIGLNPIEMAGERRVLATVADISQRRRLEGNFRSVVDAAPVGILIVGANGLIEHANAQLLRVFGYELAELSGRPMEVLLPERYRAAHPELRETYRQQPTTRAMGFNRDLTGLHKSGFEIPLEIGLNPIETEQGKAVIAIVSDVTERKRNEIKLKQLNADLDEFTYVASHDLRSPLRGIANLVDWIAEDLGETATDEVTGNLERVRVRIGRMDKLVEDLLAYARSGRRSTSVKSVDLSSLLGDVVKFVDPPQGFKVTLAGALDVIRTTPTPLETVLRNLIGNAIKHHDREQGEIRVSVCFEGRFCVFDVADDGPGIPPNAHERVFKLFQTLSNQEGTRSGIGLAVCKRLVESHGGTIELHSEAGSRGARFRFWWPRFARSDINEQSQS